MHIVNDKINLIKNIVKKQIIVDCNFFFLKGKAVYIFNLLSPQRFESPWGLVDSKFVFFINYMNKLIFIQ